MKSFLEIWDEVKNIGTDRMLLEESAKLMYEYVTQYEPKMCIEIGTHRGRSAIFIGHMLELWDGKLNTIDPYVDYKLDDGSLLFEGIEPDWYHANAADNIHKAGLSLRVTMFRAPSEEGSKFYEDHSIDMIYIDGDHSREGVAKDIHVWDPKLRTGSLVMIDDWEEMRKRIPPLPDSWKPLHIEGHLAFWEKK